MSAFGISRRDASVKLMLLTPRETEVAEHMAMGHPRIQSAKEMGISVKMIDKHLENIRTKLGITENCGIARIWFAAIVG